MKTKKFRDMTLHEMIALCPYTNGLDGEKQNNESEYHPYTECLTCKLYSFCCTSPPVYNVPKLLQREIEVPDDIDAENEAWANKIIKDMPSTVHIYGEVFVGETINRINNNYYGATEKGE